MLKVVATMTVKEDKLESFKGYLPNLINESRKESGCISYQAFQDVQNSNVIVFVEEWASQADLEKHFAAEHFTAGLALIGETLAKEAELHILSLLL